MARTRKPTFGPHDFLKRAVPAKMGADYPKGKVIDSQGDSSNSLFFIRKGTVKLAVVSKQGKEAVIAILGAGDSLGESWVAGQPLRGVAATALTPCSLLRMEKTRVLQLLHKNRAFSDGFVSYLIPRNTRIEEALVVRLFHSGERRLARALLLLSRYGQDGKPESAIPRTTHETLAETIGSTRSRVNIFMNKFRKLGFIDYNDELHVHTSLLRAVLHD